MNRFRRRGFGRIELVLLLVGIVPVLVIVGAGCMDKVRVSQTRPATTNNLRQICVALHNANDTLKHMPPAFGGYGDVKSDQSWAVHLLPYIEQDPLYKKFLSGSGDRMAVVPPYWSPLDPSPHDGRSVCNYAVNLRVMTKEGQTGELGQDVVIASGEGKPSVPRSFADGTSTVIVVATRYAHDKETFPKGPVGCSNFSEPYVSGGSGPYFGRLAAKVTASNEARDDVTFQLTPKVTNVRCTGGAPQSFAVHGVQVAMGDISVRTVSPRISVKTWNEAITPNDGNVLGSDWDN